MRDAATIALRARRSDQRVHAESALSMRDFAHQRGGADTDRNIPVIDRQLGKRMLSAWVRQSSTAREETIMRAQTLTLLLSIGAFGCSTMPKPEAREALATAQDYRAETVLAGAEARTIANGPAVIKHLETAGDGLVTLFFANAAGDGCSRTHGQGESAFMMLARSTRVANIHVPEGKRVCAVGAASRSIVVNWHVGSEQAAPEVAQYRVLAQH